VVVPPGIGYAKYLETWYESEFGERIFYNSYAGRKLVPEKERLFREADKLYQRMKTTR